MLTEPVIEARRSTAMPHALVERVGALTAGDCAGGPRQQPRGTDRTDAYRDTAIGHLLRCWVREHAVAEPTDSMLRLPLTTCGVEIGRAHV